jgi:hypothetical protein
VALIVAVATSLAAAGEKPKAKMPLVFIDGNGAINLGSASVGKHDETMEMARDLMKFCPEVSITVKEESESAPDYELLLNRQEEHGFIARAAISQIMLLRGSDKVVLYSNKKGTVAKAVRDGCKAILADWKDRTGPTATAGDHAGDQWWQPTKGQKQ